MSAAATNTSASRVRRALARGGVGLATGVLLVGGIATGAQAADQSPIPTPSAGDHRANADILDETCDVPPEHDPEIINIAHDVAVSRGVNEKVMLSLFEAGWVESHFNNLPCGHSDSVGYLQQRPSQGWGTPEECMDPVHATNAYLDQAIVNDANNPGYTAGQLAQSVQRSAYPERYDEAEAKALELIAEAEAS